MTSILHATELLQLSIFRCKMCLLRLHNPIMQVEVFGNICGSCINRSVYTSYTRNKEMEALLEKLYVCCRYAGYGCKFDGDYFKTSEHEQACCCRQISCPFIFEQKCEAVLFTKGVIDHIREKHSDSVLKAVEANGRVIVNNPTVECPVGCYLIQINGEFFFLKTNLNTEKQWISYDFYDFSNDNFDSKKINSSLIMEYGNSVFDIKRKVYVRHISVISPTYVGVNSYEIKAPRLKIKSASFFKTVKIYGEEKKKNVLWNCPRCKNVNTCIPCYTCRTFLCSYCNQSCQHVYTKKFGCSYCPLRQESLNEFCKHIEVSHNHTFNRTLYVLGVGNYYFYFTKGKEFFEQVHELRSSGEYAVTTKTLTEPNHYATYTWEVHVRSENSRHALIMSGDCNSGKRQTLNLLPVDDKTKITVNTYIKRI